MVSFFSGLTSCGGRGCVSVWETFSTAVIAVAQMIPWLLSPAAEGFCGSDGAWSPHSLRGKLCMPLPLWVGGVWGAPAEHGGRSGGRTDPGGSGGVGELLLSG